MTSGDYDLVIDPTNLWLTIHETVGHSTELDRVLGWEANFAGTSFVKPQMLEAGAVVAAPFVGPRTVVVSILAGKRIVDIEAKIVVNQPGRRTRPSSTGQSSAKPPNGANTPG